MGDEENMGHSREFFSQTSAKEAEEPLVVLMPNRILFFSVVLIFFVGVTILSVFGVVLPVLLTGDFSSMWIFHKMNYKNIRLFTSSLVWIFVLPFGFSLRNTGIFRFYKDFIEVEPYLGLKKIVFKYDEISVTVEGARRVTIVKRNLPELRHPWRRYAAKHWNGLSLGQYGHGRNYVKNLQKALRILQQNAGEFNLKSGFIF